MKVNTLRSTSICLPFLERGCPAATLRIWPWMQGVHQAPIELCGDTLEHNVEIVSQSNVMKLS